MKCFLGCFSAFKHRKQTHLMNASPFNDHKRDGVADALRLDVKIEQPVIEEPPIIVNPVLQSRDKPEEDLSDNGQKKVTFDLNAKVHEEDGNNVAENNEKEESNKEEEAKTSNERTPFSDLISSNGASYPPNHRYQNYVKEENEDMDSLDGDSKNVSGGDGEILIQEESSESLFSLSIDSRRREWHGGEVGEKEVSSPMTNCGFSPEPMRSNRDGQDTNRNPDVDCVLNPVENITQWRAVKARAAIMPLHQDKENVISEEPDLNILTDNLKAKGDKKKVVSEQGFVVDTSLSSWLVETPLSKGSADSVGNSPRNRQDRPVLGELNQVSESITPKKGSSTGIIGTVGSYWRHTGQSMDSDSGSSSGKGTSNSTREIGKDQTRKWDSTPFEARLDRAWVRITAQV